MNNADNKNDQLYFRITHKIELLIWLIIICVIIATLSLTFMSKEKNSNNDYNIFLDDVYGLIVGSPVRMMGIEVGHITKIKALKDCVYVKFVLTHPDVYIPQGTQVTVEFTGLAGSKSLELYLPEDNKNIDNSTPMFEVLPVKRIRDALGLLNIMYKKLMSIIYTSSSFSEQLKTIDIDLPQKGNFDNFIEYTDTLIDTSSVKANNLKYKLERRHK